MPPIDPRARLFNPDVWKRVSTGQSVDAQTWKAFSPEQRGAVLELRRDSFGTAAASAGGDALSGGSAGAHWAGNADPLAIHVIQGTGARSPYEGQLVKTWGIVTAIDAHGFFVQEPKPGTAAGSPAVYVFTGAAPAVKPGDDVAVQGLVVEFQTAKDAVEHPEAAATQIAAKHPGDVTVRSSGNALPEALEVDGAALSENLEGVRVRMRDAAVVGAPDRIPHLADLDVLPGSSAEPRTVAGGLQHTSPAVVAVRMNVDALPAVNVGARFDSLEGNVVERHGRFQVNVSSAGALTPSAMQPEVTTLRQRFPDDTHVLFVGSLNADNKHVKVEDVTKVKEQDPFLVSDEVGSGNFMKLAGELVNNMAAPDIVAMQEIGDNDGAELSDVTDASQTWQAIIDAIVARGGPRYAWVDRPPVNGKEGGMPGMNIRNGFLYNPARVKLDEGSVHRMDDPAFDGARVPLVATFEFKHGGETERVTLSSVHNKSKRTGGSIAEDMRAQEEGAINAWAKANAPRSEHEHLGVFGDRNAATDEKPLEVEQKDGALDLLTKGIPAERAYSTQFGGTSSLIDHAAVKTSVPVAVDVVHMNADFDARFRPTDHDGLVSAWDFRRAERSPTS